MERNVQYFDGIKYENINGHVCLLLLETKSLNQIATPIKVQSYTYYGSKNGGDWIVEIVSLYGPTFQKRTKFENVESARLFLKSMFYC